ncbi:hypothetical protein BDP81DRAFT_70866 [Colletotrichum phormii]|uniref:Uncharacterized protein n=1 Tax=Colletotrichum phormii TaxID=359342 RepID=A0AAI9ZKP7_9PEZI|nr:uncharacterized protein BDP81DRAFT_70866 [Colletotrichum phormii]KAK1633766.1 hypothetical protein BDP81DRAFT_70866 [Colletotrichum phormii]
MVCSQLALVPSAAFMHITLHFYTGPRFFASPAGSALGFQSPKGYTCGLPLNSSSRTMPRQSKYASTAPSITCTVLCDPPGICTVSSTGPLESRLDISLTRNRTRFRPCGEYRAPEPSRFRLLPSDPGQGFNLTVTVALRNTVLACCSVRT